MKTQGWMHWSGGKDSAYTLWKLAQDQNHHVCGLVTSMSEEFRRISMHGVREELLDAQASALKLPVHKLLLPKDCTMADYDSYMLDELSKLKKQGAQACYFGDIFLEDLKAYREKQMTTAGLASHFPIWQENDTMQMAKDIIASGVKAVIVCVSGKFFDPNFLGQEYDLDFLNNLPEGVDPCGENGEFHTFVYDSPLFSTPLHIQKGEAVNRTYTPGGSPEDDEDCDCCKTWDTEFHFLDITLTQ